VLNGTDVGLFSTAPPRLANSSVRFANASARPSGDYSPSTAGRDGPNALNGTTTALQPVSVPAVLANNIWVI